MAAAKNMTMNFMLNSQRIFLLLHAQSHANSLAGAYSRGYKALIELNKKIRKKHFFNTIRPIFTTNRPTDPIFQAKMTGNENIIDDRLNRKVCVHCRHFEL